MIARAELERRKRAIEDRYGPWVSHNLQLAGDRYTISPGVAGGNEARVRRVLQLVSDCARTPIAELRILDLGAFEGLFAVELARHGASVVAIEGREASLEKMRLAKDALDLDRLELRLEDVRDLDLQRTGSFDVVLCLGLLYHLDTPDVFVLLERIRDVCRGFAIIETRIAVSPAERREYRGRSYWGLRAAEPKADTPLYSRDALWASIGNPYSFHLSRMSLCNALADCGFSSVLECHLPPLMGQPPFRVTLAAFAEERKAIVTVPALNDQPWPRLPEAPLSLAVAVSRWPPIRWVNERLPKRVRGVWSRLHHRLTNIE